MARKSIIGKQNTGRKAVIYARYSSHNQKDASIEQQVEACMKKAEAQKLTVVGTYADRAISGKTDRRPQFQKMLADAALLAGQKDLAAKTYAAMADAAKGPEADFWRSRSEALGADSKPAAEQPK